MRIPAPVENLRVALKVVGKMIAKPIGIYYDRAARRRVLRGAFRLQEWAFKRADAARRLT